MNSQYRYKAKNNVSKNNPLGIGFFIIPIIILLFSYAFIIEVMEEGDYFYISPVFKNYEPLKKNEDVKMEDYFIDECGVFYEEDRHYLVNDSAEYFYEKTGVRVFVYAAPVEDNGKGSYKLPTDEEAYKTCEDVCKELSAEGIDLVVLYIPTPVGFETWTYATDEVRNVYGKKCERLIEQYLVHYFHVVGDHDELFQKSYMSAADRLMGGLTSPLCLIKENLRIVILALVTIAVVGASMGIYFAVGKKYKN